MNKVGVGDPMEVAILAHARKHGLEAEELGAKFPEVREEAFDPELKMMATIHERGASFFSAVKGAPEAVLRTCTHLKTSAGREALTPDLRSEWEHRATELGDKGFRVLAVATKEHEDAAVDPYEDLTLLGLLGFVDPPRSTSKAKVDACHGAGIRVVMVTGDQALRRGTLQKRLGLSTRAMKHPSFQAPMFSPKRNSPQRPKNKSSPRTL